MPSVIEIFLKGITLGFSAGIAPGPLTLLVITQTLQHGLREGFKVAIAPLITDIPIIFICVFTLSRFSHVPIALAIISTCGAFFLLKMAVENWKCPPISISENTNNHGSVLRGVITNLLNPHPYLFWLTIGSPIVLNTKESPFISASMFVIGMFAMMVGVKLAIAWIAKEFRPWLAGDGYRILLRASAVALTLFSMIFIKEALTQLRIL